MISSISRHDLLPVCQDSILHYDHDNFTSKYIISSVFIWIASKDNPSCTIFLNYLESVCNERFKSFSIICNVSQGSFAANLEVPFQPMYSQFLLDKIVCFHQQHCYTSSGLGMDTNFFVVTQAFPNNSAQCFCTFRSTNLR